MRAIREKYTKVYAPSSLNRKSERPEEFGVLFVTFLYGQESWRVQIIDAVNDAGEIRNTFTIPEGEAGRAFHPMPSKLRNEIAGVTLSELGQVDVPFSDGSRTIAYGEPRTEATPFREQPETFRKMEWDVRYTAAATFESGKELKETLDDPERRQALGDYLNEHREGKVS